MTPAGFALVIIGVMILIQQIENNLLELLRVHGCDDSVGRLVDDMFFFVFANCLTRLATFSSPSGSSAVSSSAREIISLKFLMVSG